MNKNLIIFADLTVIMAYANFVRHNWKRIVFVRNFTFLYKLVITCM